MSEFTFEDLEGVISQAENSLVQMLALQLRNQIKSNCEITTKCAALAAELKQSQIDASCYKKGMEASNERLVQVAAENAGLKGAIKEIVDSAEEAEYEGYFSFVVNPDAIHAGADLIESETPATNSFLALVEKGCKGVGCTCECAHARALPQTIRTRFMASL